MRQGETDSSFLLLRGWTLLLNSQAIYPLHVHQRSFIKSFSREFWDSLLCKGYSPKPKILSRLLRIQAFLLSANVFKFKTIFIASALFQSPSASSDAVFPKYFLVPDYVLQASSLLSLFIWFSLLERSYVFLEISWNFLPFLETAVPSETRFYNKTVFYASQKNKRHQVFYSHKSL